MHETVIANKIITKAKEQGKVNSIVVEVGDLAHLPAKELVNNILNAVNDFSQGMPQFDDITLMVIKFV